MLVCGEQVGTTESTMPIHPPGDVCYRGGGFLDDHWEFFESRVGMKFRQPSYLATSFDVNVANGFIFRSAMPSRVRWTIRIDPERKCKHVNLVMKSNVPGEQEYLFVPYSAFTVLSVARKSGTAGELDVPALCHLRPERLFHCDDQSHTAPSIRMELYSPDRIRLRGCMPLLSTRVF